MGSGRPHLVMGKIPSVRKAIFLLMILSSLSVARVQVVCGDERGISVRPKAANLHGSGVATDQTTKAERVLRALIIGIDRFQDEKIRELRFCRADASGLMDLVSDTRYVPFDRVEATTLIDHEATKERVRAALEELGKRSAPQDTVIVYFSSHGIQQDQGEAYWVLHDSRVDLTAYDMNRLRVIPETALGQSEITRLLNRIRGRRLLVLIDSCFSAATVISYPRGKNFQSLNVKNPFEVFKGEGRVIITASEGSQKAVELPGLGHGAFTYFLLKGLKGKADRNMDNVVELWEIWQFLDQKVTDAARSAGGDQWPTLSSIHLTHGFPLTTYPVGDFLVMASPSGNSGQQTDDLTETEWVTIEGKALQPLRISATEISNRQFLDFVRAKPSWGKDRIPSQFHDGDYLRHWPGPDNYPEGLDDHPVTYVSWFAAKAFAEWAGGSLPTESEWITAASGGKGSATQPGVTSTQLYPWGNQWNPALCNNSNSPNPGPIPVHGFEPGGSRWPSGVIYNMAGNVWEWCGDWVFVYSDPSSAKEFVEAPVGADRKPVLNRLIKGGSFMADRLGCMIPAKVWADPRLCAKDGGFRVVRK